MDPESIAAKADMAEIEEYRERKNIDDQRAEVANVQGRVNLDAGIDAIVAQAQEICAEARAQAPVESKSSRLSNINENRQAEIDEMNEEYRRERLEELGISNPERTSITSPQDTGEEHIPRPRFSNVLSIQERKMKQHGEKK
jgi:hypothetical protein